MICAAVCMRLHAEEHMPPSILVVDDDESIREFVHMALSDEGYSVLQAANGSAALEIVRREPIDLIILDMRMPIMDGWAFLTAYQRVTLPRAPVIAVSANNRAISATTADVVDFIPKPFDLGHLLDLIASHTQPPTVRNGL